MASPPSGALCGRMWAPLGKPGCTRPASPQLLPPAKLADGQHFCISGLAGSWPRAAKPRRGLPVLQVLNMCTLSMQK